MSVPEIQAEPGTTASGGIQVIPRPATLTPGHGVFLFSPKTTIAAGMGTEPEAAYLADELAPAMGFRMHVTPFGATAPSQVSIVLELDDSLKQLGDEGYRLNIGKNLIEARALKPAGIFYACQTLRQLLPPEALGRAPVSGVQWSVPCLSIEDKPRFAWRGHLFDCCRHFYSKQQVKRAIDLLALHKLNRLHWHLTEDQGWRIEIKRYPRLTEVGAWRALINGEKYGGWYSQEDVREIVSYAAKRHVTVVPEIEMPGHSSAALASYPELGCTGGPYQVQSWWGVYPDVYCPGNDATLNFLENVLEEVLALFPSQYIHIGGDECPKDRWEKCPRCQARIKDKGLKDTHELQSWFVRHFDSYLAARGRRLVGWDEILEGGLAPGAVVQSWRGIQGGIQAASEGHDVIMSPGSHCYLDHSYSKTPVALSYAYEPVAEELATDGRHHVLGLEGNMWTEWVADLESYDFLVYPRMTALAEVAWSPAKDRTWSEFEPRLEAQLRRLDVVGVQYARLPAEKITPDGAVSIGEWDIPPSQQCVHMLEYDVTSQISGAGEYVIIFVHRGGRCGLWIEWTALMQDDKEVARDTHHGVSYGDIVSNDTRSYAVKLPEHCAARYVVRAKTHIMDGADTKGEVMIKKLQQS